MPSSREQSPTKRRLAEDLTPRPSRKRTRTPDSRSSYSRLSQSQTTESSRKSGQISPQKHLKALERTGRGILVRDIDGLSDHPSQQLASLLKEMRNVMRSRGILPQTARHEFENSKDRRIAELGEDWTVFSAERDTLGHVPSQESVLALLRTARECHENFHSESSWNILVHSRLLGLALQLPDSECFPQFIDFLPCSSASIIPDYLLPLSPSKKVDFCICFNPSLETSPDICAAIEAARGCLPGNAINHTGYYPLRKRPIALSIETKMTGQGWDSAALQLSVWQASHWNFLQELNDLALAKSAAHRVVWPDFLPCVMIQGHTWQLLITTREESRTPAAAEELGS
ncbi:hypothetical protein AK830_g11981 [Neonectria ditissima]|uniref:PD-(D/E)XK nuclease-like domain-containing protein n=1 Tax=Neonectria ditissima TaxID=78410 RepID=A0A0P7B1C7_9HYPO|nr:hypothetical protein AK830_g11981 [Neonectria ditissima]